MYEFDEKLSKKFFFFSVTYTDVCGRCENHTICQCKSKWMNQHCINY